MPYDLDALEALIPDEAEIGANERLCRLNFMGAMRRGAFDVPMLDPPFVVRQGPNLHVLDVRDPTATTGAVGAIPGAAQLPEGGALAVIARIGRDAMVAVVDEDGRSSARATVMAMREAGMHYAAMLDRGMEGWRRYGLAVTRNPLPVLGEQRAAAPLHDADVLAHVRDPTNVRWVRLSTLLLHTGMACVDGREAAGVVGTPGGDLGELLLVLSAFERHSGRALSGKAIGVLMRRRIDTFGACCSHTDTIANDKLVDSLRADTRLAAATERPRGSLAWRQLFHRPPAHLREAMLDHLLVAEHIGCGHLRLAFEQAERYAVRHGLMVDVLAAYHRARWDGAHEPTMLPLAGFHAETGVAIVRVEPEPGPFDFVPLVSPQVGDAQLFVHHPQVAAYVRDAMALWLAAQRDVVGDVDAAALTAEVHALGTQQLEATLATLAPGLPRLDIVLKRAVH